jgi:hypothetical protein
MKSNSLRRTRGRRSDRFLLLLLLVCLGWLFVDSCASDWEEAQQVQEPESVSVGFVYVDDQASAVCVAGSFNGWSEEADCMTPSGDIWSVAVSLRPGRHQYMFVVDSRFWRKDPGAQLAEDDGFGSENSVLVVE